MVIGFIHTSNTVSEAEKGEVDVFPVQVGVHSMVTSEVPIEVEYRVVNYDKAIVRSAAESTKGADALFGTRTDGRLTVVDTLQPNTTRLRDVVIQVINDLQSENERECLRISIETSDVIRTAFECEMGSNRTYSCSYTLCIIDDDGVLSCQKIKV